MIEALKKAIKARFDFAMATSITGGLWYGRQSGQTMPYCVYLLIPWDDYRTFDRAKMETYVARFTIYHNSDLALTTIADAFDAAFDYTVLAMSTGTALQCIRMRPPAIVPTDDDYATKPVFMSIHEYIIRTQNQ